MNKEVKSGEFQAVQGAALANEAEWEVRVDLAAMFRLTHIMGWDDTIWNHITPRVPGTDNTFLMHRFGLLYEEITASNLIKVDEHGNVLEGPTDVNTAGFVIHSAIHLHHPENLYVFHAHPPTAQFTPDQIVSKPISGFRQLLKRMGSPGPITGFRPV